MKAVIQDKYGSSEGVLQVREIAEPVAGQGEVLVRAHAASVHADVWHVVTGIPYVLRLMGAGLVRPKNPVPGIDLAGVVASIGQGVKRFQPGDMVLGKTQLGHEWCNGGSFAEYAVAPEEGLVMMPPKVSFAQAASIVTSGIIAWGNLLNGGKLHPGKRILVNGAGGGVGSIAVQLAKAHDAWVTAVDHPDKLPMILALGADQVIDYTQKDITQVPGEYDLIFDVASNLSLKRCKPILAPNGIFVLIGHDHYGSATGHLFGSLPRFLWLFALATFVKQLPKLTSPQPSAKEALTVLADLLASGQLTPLIDSTYKLNEVQAAMRRLKGGQALGKIVITP